MNLSAFTENFGLIVNSPQGVLRLRKCIFAAAVKGSLVPQDPNDEHAEILVDRIRDQKRTLISDGEIKLTTSHTVRNLGAHGFKLQMGWTWVTLDEITAIGTGSTPPKANREYYVDGTVPWITSAATNAEFIKSPEQWITEQAVVDRNLKIYPKGSLVVALYGQGKTRGQVGQLMFDSTMNQACAGIKFFGDGCEIRDYIRLFFKKKYDEIRELAAGGAQPNLSGGMIRLTQIPLPPLAEQKRIVASVNELMKLCDQLERQQLQRSRLLPLLSKASHARLAEIPNPANLDAIFTNPPTLSPEDMRKTILSLAVRGKLVTQRSDDDSVDQLIAEIDEQRAEYAASRKFKSSVSFDRVDPAKSPYEIPITWRWVRLGRIVVNRDGERIPLSKSQRASLSKTYDYYGASGVIDKVDKFLFDKTLLLIGEDGANLISRSTPIAFLARGKYWVNNHAHVLDGISDAFLEFIAIHINAINLEPYVTGTAQPKMNQAKMNSILIGLPPLREQERIVKRVRQLMELTDVLESKRDQAQEASTLFARAIVAEITETEADEQKDMKAPKTELVTRLASQQKPTKADMAPLSAILLRSKTDVSAKELWQKSGLEIDAFYSQLKLEMSQGWIIEPTKGFMKEVAND